MSRPPPSYVDNVQSKFNTTTPTKSTGLQSSVSNTGTLCNATTGGSGVGVVSTVANGVNGVNSSVLSTNGSIMTQPENYYAATDIVKVTLTFINQILCSNY